VKKILFAGSFIEDTYMKELWANSKSLPVISGDKFQKSLINGLLEIPNSLDYIITAPAIGSYPLRYREFHIKSTNFIFSTINGQSVPFFNFMYFKNTSIYNSLYKGIERWIKRDFLNNNTIIVYSLVEPYIKAVVAIKKKYPHVKICAIVLDLPQYFDEPGSVLFNFLVKKQTKRIYSLAKNIDSFIFLTESMSTELIGLDIKPYLVLEGIYFPKELPKVQKSKKTILYTGKLDHRFGINELLDSFSKINDEEAKLWICGDGNAKMLVENASLKDGRIKYFGVVNQEEVILFQQKATLLINPRQAVGEYTKFSFPSKTMEYLASGTPTVMYKLPGVPEEYYDHIICVESNSNDDLTKTLTNWLSKDQIELDQFGKTAKEFILKNKTSKIQALKVFSFINAL
jgi:glycosyltransferase involved in cell wall biosynthesis